MSSVRKLTIGESCDTFVVFGKTPTKAHPEGEKCVVFGKNSDRPHGESQEVVFENAKDHSPGDTVQCTYVKVPQCRHTFAVLLSKPAWMWGAEMGANEMGVVIGNEAVWNRLIDPEEDLKPRLLGMDLLRLGLERGASAEKALSVITDLLEEFGQGGPCSDTVQDFAYHNAILIADATEAWVLETAGRWWVAERVTEGTRNISNCMSVTTKIDRIHPRLKEHALQAGWWSKEEKGPFDWSEVISNEAMQQIGSGAERFACGSALLKEVMAVKNEFLPKSMMRVLRDQESGICRPYTDEAEFPTTGSQVSLLLPPLGSTGSRNCHWFTATSDPQRALFKPTPSFEFLKHRNEGLSALTASHHPFPGKVKDSAAERCHDLWSLHRDPKVVAKTNQLGPMIEELEKKLLQRVSVALLEAQETSENIFDDAAKMEIHVYRKFSGSKL